MDNELLKFNITKKIGNYFYIDENHKKWTIPQGLLKNKIIQSKIYNYTDILDFELIEDGNSVSKGGIGRAIVGGALFGGIGAIVGATTGHKQKQTCSILQIKIILNSMNSPIEYITLINTEIKKSSNTYKLSFNIAQQILSVLQIICESNKSQKLLKETNHEPSSNIDEIRKYKQLLDCGAITEEEFNIKKKKLLNL